jgi:hypothetical protein
VLVNGTDLRNPLELISRIMRVTSGKAREIGIFDL